MLFIKKIDGNFYKIDGNFRLKKKSQTPSGVCRCRYLAVGGRFDVFVDDDFADGIRFYDACAGVFDACDVAVDGGIDLRIFKSQVGILAQTAIFQHKVVAVAKWLCLTD